jgi:hypothetical protein
MDEWLAGKKIQKGGTDVPPFFYGLKNSFRGKHSPENMLNKILLAPKFQDVAR